MGIVLEDSFFVRNVGGGCSGWGKFVNIIDSTYPYRFYTDEECENSQKKIGTK